MRSLFDLAEEKPPAPAPKQHDLPADLPNPDHPMADANFMFCDDCGTDVFRPHTQCVGRTLKALWKERES